MRKFVLLSAFVFTLLFISSSAYAAPTYPTGGLLRGVPSDKMSPVIGSTDSCTDGTTNWCAFATGYTWTLPEAHTITKYYLNASDINAGFLYFYDSRGNLMHKAPVSTTSLNGAIPWVDLPELKGVKQIKALGGTYYLWDFDVISTGVYDNVPPDNPTGLQGTSQVEQLSFTWNANTESDMKGYNLYKNGTKINGALIESTSYIEMGVIPDQIYSYQVTAVDKYGNESGKSNSVVISAMAAPQKPVITYTDLKHNSVRLLWDKVAPNFEIYQDGVLITKPTSAVAFFDVTGLSPVTQYTFKIIAIDKYSRRVESDPIVLKTTEPVPDKPLLSFSDVTHNSLKASWQPVQYANNYLVYLDGVLKGAVTDTFYDFSGLAPDTVHVVKIQAKSNLHTSEAELSVRTKKAPVPEILNASVKPVSGSPNKQTLSYTANEHVTEVNVYVNGQLVGTYPVSQNNIELDFASISDKFASIKLEPTDPEAKPYEFKALTKSTGSDAIDAIIAAFLSAFEVLKKSLLYLALAAIALTIVVTAYFWFRGKYKKMAPDRSGENKPFAYASNKESPSKLKKMRRGFSTDDTPDEKEKYGKGERFKPYFKMSDKEKLEYRSQKHFEKTGFHIKDIKVQRVPVGFLGTAGTKVKQDITYERNGVEYKQRFVKGQGKVYAPKDISNKIKLVSNQYKAVKSRITGSNKKQF